MKVELLPLVLSIGDINGKNGGVYEGPLVLTIKFPGVADPYVFSIGHYSLFYKVVFIDLIEFFGIVRGFVFP